MCDDGWDEFEKNLWVWAVVIVLSSLSTLGIVLAIVSRW